MTKRYAVLLFAAAFLLVAAPTFAQTYYPCQEVNGPGPSLDHYECMRAIASSSNFDWYGPSQDQMCYMYPPAGLYKSLGAYGSGYGSVYYTTPNNFAYFSFMIILDLNNTQYHSGDRVSVLVYDDDNYTVETLGTIDGSGGDICSGQYYFNVYRPGWASTSGNPARRFHLTISPWFQDYNANAKVGTYSLTVYDHQAW
jgi:hypothetical protein